MTRCKAITATGKQCSRTATVGDFCTQHSKNASGAKKTTTVKKGSTVKKTAPKKAVKKTSVKVSEKKPSTKKSVKKSAKKPIKKAPVKRVSGKKYRIRSNGDAPLEVTVKGKNVEVRTESCSIDGTCGFVGNPLFTFNAKKVFIGKDIVADEYEMTLSPREHGNSILVEIADKSYVYIGTSILSFKTKAKVVDYFSPISDAELPFPYAIDSNGDFYLMAIDKTSSRRENKIVMMTKDKVFDDDPYQDYYSEEKRKEKINYLNVKTIWEE
jgi:hypothetical protein